MAHNYENYYKEYNKRKCMRLSLNLSIEKDEDIIKAIDSGNKQGSIKELLRAGIESKNK